MKQRIENKPAANDKKAKAGHTINNVKMAGSSCVHDIVRTKEQADFFMKLLKQLKAGNHSRLFHGGHDNASLAGNQ